MTLTMFRERCSTIPNLSVLATEDCYGFSSLTQMTQRARERGVPFLTNLKQVHIQRQDLGNLDNEEQLSHKDPLLSLPSVNWFSTSYCFQLCWTKDLLKQYQVSTITDLHLYECVIDSELLAKFIQRFQRLRSFVYTTYTKDRHDQLQCPPDVCNQFTLRVALESNVSSTLRDLTILKNATQTSRFMGSTSAFKALETVHTELPCLVPQLGFSISDEKEDTFAILFPLSIKVIHVRVMFWGFSQDCKDLICLAIRAKGAHNSPAPHLESLIFELSEKGLRDALESVNDPRDASGFAGKTLRSRCKEVGLTLFLYSI